MTRKKMLPVDDGTPVGLREKGIALWQRLTAEYDFGAAPEKLLILDEGLRAPRATTPVAHENR